MDSEHRPPLPATAYLVIPNIALACILAAKTSFPVRFLVLMGIAAAIIRATTTYTAGHNRQNYGAGCMFAIIFCNACHLLVLSDPMEEYRHESHPCPPSSLPLLRRVYWAMCIVVNPRGVGWNYKTPHLPAPPQVPRLPFCLRQLRRAASLYLIIDAMQTYVLLILDPMHTSGVGELLPLSSRGYVWLCVNVSVRWSLVRLHHFIQQSVLSFMHVALGLSEPRDWPDVYGSWAESYTVRRFWGRTWHQMLRRFLTSMGKSCCRAFDARPGSWQSSYIQLYAAFAVSALLHVGGDVMANRRLAGGSFWFFFSQAVAITFEDAVIGVARRAGIRVPVRAARILGYMWTFWWGTFSLGPYLSYLRFGAKSRMFPLSPIMLSVEYLQRLELMSGNQVQVES